MLFLIVFLNTALLFMIPILAIPIYSRALNPATLLNAYLSPPLFNLTNKPPDPRLSGPTQILCFDNKSGLNLTAVAEDCASLLDDVISRLDGLSEKRVFFNQKYMNSNGRWVPARWTFGQCTVNARSGQSTSVDLFTLLEVALSANSILSDCVTSYRKGQGGFMPIGSREASYKVVLQGSLPDVEVNTISDADALTLPSSKDSKQTLSNKRAMHSSTGLQPLMLDPSVALNETLSLSNSTGDLRANTEHEVDCFPRGSPLPPINEDDCRWVIHNIILGMKDPLREQTWGYTDAVDNNISLRQYRWIFKGCTIQVRNLDRRQVDRFRPVDVAEVAQRIVQTCVAEMKVPVGGNADIGRLAIPKTFYVVASGVKILGGGTTSNNTILSLPSNGLGALESRASLNSPGENVLLTEGLNESHPAHCFEPDLPLPLEPAVASDCDFIINNIILSLPNPMLEQTFGYTDDVDIDLSIDGNGRWIYHQCIVILTNRDKTTGRFRFLDVAYTAHRIMEQCIEGSKYALGGTAQVGAPDSKFHVGVGGIDRMDIGNGTIRDLASPKTTPSSSGIVPVFPSRYDTDPVDFAKRSSKTIEVSQASKEFAPVVRCFKSGMPAARQVDVQDCTDAAMLLLRDPKILVPQTFTTESTGGIKMPFVQHNKSCYFMVDTTLHLSVSEIFTLLEVVYWASAIMLRCISGGGQGFGGVSKIDEDRGIFVSVTGVNPTIVGDDLAELSNQSSSAIRLENTTTQIADLGQS